MNTKQNNEDFIDIQGFEGIYQINREGRIRDISCKKPEYLETGLDHFENPTYILTKKNSEGQVENFRSHARNLVAIHFLPDPGDTALLIHKDFNKLNIAAENLQWVKEGEGLCHIIEGICESMNIKPEHDKISKLHFIQDENELIRMASDLGLTINQAMTIRHHYLWAELKWLRITFDHPDGCFMWKAISKLDEIIYYKHPDYRVIYSKSEEHENLPFSYPHVLSYRWFLFT